MTEPEQKPRRASHLMDPSAPRVIATAEDRARLERVQRTVMSVLVFVTIFHLSCGLVIGALYIHDQFTVARYGLCIIGGVTGVLGVAATRAIHHGKPISLWLLAGTVPGIVGVVLVSR